MKVLHFIPNMTTGGGERQLIYLAGGLVSLGVEVGVCLGSGGPQLKKLEATGAHVFNLNARHSYSPALLKIPGLIKSWRADIVQTWFRQMDIVAGSAALFKRIPWILSERSSREFYPRSLKHTLRLRLGSLASSIVANSEGGAGYWRDFGRISPVVIHNALPLRSLEAAVPYQRQEVGIRPADKLIISIARLDSGKNFLFLLDAFALLRKQLREVVLVLCGEGPERGRIQERVAELGLNECVRLVGSVAEPWRWMKTADLFVTLSRFEGQPNAVLEAMACHCGIVASEIEGHRALLDEQSAYFVGLTDPNAVCRTMLTALTNKSETSAKVARAGAKIIRFTVERVAAEYLKVYTAVLPGGSLRRESR